MPFKLIDNKIKKNFKHYILQCSLATLTMLGILTFLDVLTETAIIASLGSSVFIVFAMPWNYCAEPRRLIGGYMVASIVGIVFYFLSEYARFEISDYVANFSLLIYSSLAVGFAIFIMVATDTEHAPAAGLSLGLVLNSWDYITIVLIISAVIWMSAVHKLLKTRLIDLL